MSDANWVESEEYVDDLYVPSYEELVQNVAMATILYEEVCRVYDESFYSYALAVAMLAFVVRVAIDVD